MAKKKATGGTCYRDAYHLMRDLVEPDWRLCHGVVVASSGPHKGKPHGHAWIERGRLVLDASGVLVGMARYYIVGDVRDVARFSMGEAMEKCAATGNYGPWNHAIVEAEKWVK